MTSMSARNTVQCLIERWRYHGLPRYAQFDNGTVDTKSKFENGHWMARKLGDDHWIKIPPEAVEYERTSPDGRSHLCSEFYMVRMYGLVDKVYCFIPGVGF